MTAPTKLSFLEPLILHHELLLVCSKSRIKLFGDDLIKIEELSHETGHNYC